MGAERRGGGGALGRSGLTTPGSGTRVPAFSLREQGTMSYTPFHVLHFTILKEKRLKITGAKRRLCQADVSRHGGARGLAGGWLGRQTMEPGARPAPQQRERHAVEAGTACGLLWRTRNGPTPTVKTVAPSGRPAKRAEPAWPVCTCRGRESLPCLHKPIPPGRSVPPSFIFPVSFEVFVLILTASATLLQRCCGVTAPVPDP